MSAKDLKLSGGKLLHQTAPSEGREGPLVTVVTAVFNGVTTIKECIESVSRQDYPHLEHIVIDAGSTDGTIDVLRKYEDRIALWISEPDRGVYDAWNKGLHLAHGEWIGFMGADDEYLPGAIATYMALASDNPAADYLSSQLKWVHPSGYSRLIGGRWERSRFRRCSCVAHVGSLHRRRLFEQYGVFDTSYRIAGDYEFLLRAGDDLHAVFTPTVTVLMRAGGLSDSTAGLLEAKRAQVQNKIHSALVAQRYFYARVMRFHVRRLLVKATSLFKAFSGA
jgi:glycosyltransferase involved in cell wall biosynthesis